MEDRRKSHDERFEVISVTLARIEEKMQSAERAVFIAKEEVDRRLAEMNEMRRQIAEERNEFMDRKEYEVKHESLITQIRNLEKFQWGIIGGIGVFQILITLILHYWHG